MHNMYIYIYIYIYAQTSVSSDRNLVQATRTSQGLNCKTCCAGKLAHCNHAIRLLFPALVSDYYAVCPAKGNSA